MNRFTALGLSLPIIQAPMAGVQGSALAVAVSNAGALGSLPCAMLSETQMAAELKILAAQAHGPYNVNFFCHHTPQPSEEAAKVWANALAPFYAEWGLDAGQSVTGPSRMPFSQASVDALAVHNPPVVSFHFGLPSAALLAQVRQWGSAVIASATTVAEALYLEANGVDAIIAQGLEAGGHRGHFLSHDLTEQMGTFALLPQVVAAVRVPVIAAGGIAHASGVRAALALGASAVQVGTAYLLCSEATTSPIHRAALQSVSAPHTALTNLFTGRPARGMLNRAMRELGNISPMAPEFPMATAAMAPLRAAAERAGFGDFSPLWAGQNTSGCQSIGAADLTKQLGAGLAY